MTSHNDVLINDIGATGVFPLMAETLGDRRRNSAPKRPAAPAPAGGVVTAMRLMTAADARGNDTEACVPGRSGPAEDRAHALVRAKSALWMAAGYVGAAGFVVSVTKILEGADNPLQTAVYAIAAALVSAVAWRGAWRVLMNGTAPSVLDTPPYAVRANPEAVADVEPLAPALSERYAGVLR